MRIADFDLSKESLEMQEFFENTKKILNNGAFEIKVTASAAPDFDAPKETIFVLSLYGTQYRLYVSYNQAWYYVTLTKA